MLRRINRWGPLVQMEQTSRPPSAVELQKFPGTTESPSTLPPTPSYSVASTSDATSDNVAIHPRALPSGSFQAWVPEVRATRSPEPAHLLICSYRGPYACEEKCPLTAQFSHDAEDGAVIRNIEACQAISQTVQTSLGPYGRNKIVINHLQKMILTSDAATILRELDVVHPAAKLLVMASQQQDAEMGDGTNLVIVLAGELLKKAEELIRMGLKTSDIVSGYEKAQNYALKVLEGMLS